MVTWTTSEWTEWSEDIRANPAHLCVYEVLELARRDDDLLGILEKDPREVNKLVLRASRNLEIAKEEGCGTLKEFYWTWDNNYGENIFTEEKFKRGKEEKEKEENGGPSRGGMSLLPEGSEVPGPSVREPSVEPSVREPSVRSTPKRKVSATFWEVEGAVEDVERLITEVKKPKK